jgi:hypothetical protein
MDQPGKGHNLESFLTILLEEVVKADMTMQERQLEAWKHFSDFKPRGDHINDDIDAGWAQQRYLALDEVKFRFHVTLVRKGFFRRFRQGMRYIFGKHNPHAFEPSSYLITESENPDAIEVTVTVKQEEKGRMKVSYEPVDADTKKIFLNSPFLQKSTK